MSRAIYFVQECPTCGRHLQVRVAYLGKLVACQHCRGRFEASDPSSCPPQHDSGIRLLQRAEELIASADIMKRRSG